MRLFKPEFLQSVTSRRGMALLITLTIITLLIVTTTELNRRARVTIYATAAIRDRLILSQMLISGVNAAQAMLVEDKKTSEIDSIQEDWADPEKISELLQSLAFEEGALTVRISDERGRIQVNALVKYPEGQAFNRLQLMVWERFLSLASLYYDDMEEMDSVNTIINSIKDWIDSGDDDAITGLTGAESDYYEDLDPPYTARNAPFTYLPELMQVKGITTGLFYGKEEAPGISSYLTVSGMTDEGGKGVTFNGKININTADMPVLMTLLPEVNEDLVLAINDYRLEKSADTYIHNLSSSTWYKDVPGAGDLDIDPDLITTRSDFFRIEAEASLGEITMAATAVVKRERDDRTGQIRCRVLSWEQN